LAQGTGETPAFEQDGFFDAGPSVSGGFADPTEALDVTASFSLAPQKLGSENAARFGVISVTADISPGWHIYSITQPPGGPIATTVAIAPAGAKGYETGGPFTTNIVPERKTVAAFGKTVVETHHGKLTWRAPLKIAAGADPSTLEIRGTLRAQPCTENSCLPPKDYPFVARFSSGGLTNSLDTWPQDNGKAAAGSTVFSPGEMKIAANEEIANTPIIVIVLMSFAGGFILNLMPCVLPVVGLKLLSFVEQSGQSRSRAFMLNFWYSLGLMSVFMVLATLAVGVGIGWGMLFQYSGFTITLTAVVFVMALSFFGVWEIPIPGFAGRGKAGELSQREGAGGAFAKGILTTFLATPCSAPLLAPALAWTTSRSPLEVYMVFFFVGLGMAFPYLLIGAFPKLIRFLPKPGDWMETFKHIMGFVLLATVVYLFTTLHPAHTVPAIALMFGLWAACWWVGRTPPMADRQTKILHWLQAAVFTGIIIVVAYPGIDEVAPKRISFLGKNVPISFGGIYDVMNHRLERLVEKRLAAAGNDPEKKTTEEEIAWIPFTRKGLDERLAQGETVLVDFTADWCMTCKTLEATVLDTPAVRKALAENNIVTMQADWTHGDVEITEMLKNLGSKQVPVIAIFPANRPNRPIVLRGGYTSGGLIEAIEEAGIKKR
jgi:thiol:disulfide interchange protein DsbD